jgi:hypothetical protein
LWQPFRQAENNVEIQWLLQLAVGAASGEAEGMDPKMLEEAKERSDWSMWEEAIQKELKSLHKANTWSVVNQPAGKNIIGCKWAFCIKKNCYGTVHISLSFFYP